MDAELSDVNDRICKAVDSNSVLVKEIGYQIWKTPETNFEEHTACSLLTEVLEGHGFVVERNIGGLATAFSATYGSGAPHVAVLCEYDALPEIGHACGHNLIAEAGLSAALGLKPVMLQCSLPGKLTVFGTPAEEGGGGKVILLQKGFFADVDAVMMVHPSPYNDLMPIILAARELEVIFRGSDAHASAFPWKGVNALDAAVVAYSSLSVLRQQMKPTWRLQAIITHGGVDVSIIPSESRLRVCVRAPTKQEFDDLLSKVTACLQAAAAASGCQFEVRETGFNYQHLRNNAELAKVFAKHCSSLGIVIDSQVHHGDLLISSDIGDVSGKVPTIHPLYSIGDTFNHTVQFAETANTPEAHRVTQEMGKAMAMSAAEILIDKQLLQRIADEFHVNIATATSD